MQPLLGQIARADKAVWYQLLLMEIYALNKDLFRSMELFITVPGNIGTNIKTMDLLIEAALTNLSAAKEVFSLVLLELRYRYSHGVLYIADEHNELWKNKVQRRYPFKDFTTFGGPLDGVHFSTC